MKKQTGFTLIELLVTIALISILMSFAVPGMNTFTMNDRLVTQINSLNGHLAYARSEAVKRNQQVSLCVSSDSGTAAPSCTGGNQWEGGWLIYVDSNNSDTLNADEEVLRVHTNLKGGTTLSSAVAQVTYDYRGFVEAGSVSSFSLCDQRGSAHGKSIAVTLTGRVKKQEIGSC